MRFCKQLYRAFYETEMLHQRKDLRHKNFVDPGKTDRELFADLELGDCWSDANLAKTYFYARENRHLHILSLLFKSFYHMCPNSRVIT